MVEKNTVPESISKEEEGQFIPQKIYIKDLSFETPNSPQIFTEEWQPMVNMDLSSKAKLIGNKLYEVVLSLTLTVSTQEKVAYLVEAHQAGIFHIEGFTEFLIERIVATNCPNILFPFAREHVADIIIRGGFPQLLLAPVNFEVLYQQQNTLPDDKETKH